MRTVELEHLYRLGRSLGELGHLPKDATMTREMWGLAADARHWLRVIKMVYPELHEAIGPAWGLLEMTLDPLVSDVSDTAPLARSRVSECASLAAHIKPLTLGIDEFSRAVGRGAERLYVVMVTEMRLYDSRRMMLKGEKILDASVRDIVLPRAIDELKDATRCLGLDLWTAAGLHTLRAIEAVLRTYFAVLPVGPPKQRNWGTYLDTVKPFIDASLHLRLDALRKYDRNTLMHVDDVLNRTEALDLFQYGATVMADMAQDMAERAAR